MDDDDDDKERPSLSCIRLALMWPPQSISLYETKRLGMTSYEEENQKNEWTGRQSGQRKKRAMATYTRSYVVVTFSTTHDRYFGNADVRVPLILLTAFMAWIARLISPT
jgi:hypothetical protein